MMKQVLQNRPVMNIDFRDISFTVPDRRGLKKILNSVSGRFCCGQISAILGPSGAGKSTLMNILMGLQSVNVTGEVLVNQRPRNLKTFNQMSTYIMQEDLLEPFLSVQEAMELAANLKLPASFKREEKLMIVNEVLSSLGLTSCRNTKTDVLSGGQRKRLSVALELVNNPPVIFLDEPTTGLDSVATNQMAQLLKFLAKEGRTVVCSIHQPSAPLFSTFDHVYFLANGYCVYQGQPQMLVPFLDNVGLHCPKTHNPADFIMEVIHDDSKQNTNLLSAEMRNGKVNSRLPEDCQETHVTEDQQNRNYKQYKILNRPPSFLRQFKILLCLMLTQKIRNKLGVFLQVICHMFLDFTLGALYYNMGNSAEHTFANFNMVIAICVFFTYTYTVIPALTYPGELRLVKREYQNHWYNAEAYYLARMISSIPFQIALGTLHSCILYPLIGQPMELLRFLLFAVFSIVAGFVAEGHGMTVGTIFKEVNGAIVSPATMAPMLALSIVGLGYGPYTEPIMNFLRSISYMRYSVVGLTISLYGMDRPNLQCESFYCHYIDPEVFLRDVGVGGNTVPWSLFYLSIHLVLFRITAFLALRYRLSLDFNLRLRALLKNIMRHRALAD